MPKPTLKTHSKPAIRQPMDGAHCFIAVISSEVAKFEMPQIKRRYSVFLICLPLPADPSARGVHPLARRSREELRRFGNNGAKIHIFFDTDVFYDKTRV